MNSKVDENCRIEVDADKNHFVAQNSDSGLGSDSEEGELSRDCQQKQSPSLARKLWNSFRFVVSVVSLSSS